MGFFSFLFPGDLGITQTVNAMRSLTLGSPNYSEVRARAEMIAASCAERDEFCEVSKVFAYTLAHYRYQRDPVGMEFV